MQRLAHALQQAREFEVGRGEFGAAIDHHHDGVGLFERDARLAKDLGRDQRIVVGNDAAGIDHAQQLARPFGFAIETVAGDAGLVADDGTARSDQAVEERDLPTLGRPTMASVPARGRSPRRFLLRAS